MKAVLHYAAGLTLRSSLAAPGGKVEIVVVDPRDRNGFDHEIADAEVLLHVLERVTEDMIDAAPKLRLIQKIGVGVDTIDLEACRRRDIAVCNMPGTNTAAVAEMTLALMLAVLRRIARMDAETRAGRGWSLAPELLDGLGEIGGRTVGLVGYGGVAQRLVPVLRALEARPIVWSRHAPAGLVEAVGLDELVERADIVSLHVPAAAETIDLFNAERIAAMKPGAILINTARGALVDENALVDALIAGRLGGAGLDVFRREPLSPDHPLLRLPNVVLTPHVAWPTDGTLARSLAVATENCRRLDAGESLLHRIV